MIQNERTVCRGGYTPREIDKTTDESNLLRKSLVELGAFNTFETYVYGMCAGIGSLISTGTLDVEKIADGMAGLFYLSPII